MGKGLPGKNGGIGDNCYGGDDSSAKERIQPVFRDLNEAQRSGNPETGPPTCEEESPAPAANQQP